MGARRGRKRWAVIAVAVAVAALVAGALAVVFGGGGECSPDGYPGSPECVAREYVTRRDASKCDLVAPALLEQLTRSRGAEARERCVEGVRAGPPPPEEVDVLERETVGEGRVIVELLSDGQEGKVTLARAGGRWQIVSFDE